MSTDSQNALSQQSWMSQENFGMTGAGQGAPSTLAGQTLDSLSMSGTQPSNLGLQPRPWPMPAGFRQRLAAPYLAQVYKGGTTALEYARRWIQNHRLEKCSPAQDMLSIMEAVGDSIVTDQRDVINSVAFEKLTRRAYGLERAYENCWTEEDWKRPDSARGKAWKSKVQWDLCDQYDVRGQSQKGTRVAVAYQEAKESMEREASFMKYYSKMSERRAAGD